MAKITQKQVNDINSKCKNGFTFYTRGFVEAGRKELIKTIMLKENEKMVEAKLRWMEEIVKQKNLRGQVVPQRTGNVVPMLCVCVWISTKESRAWISCGFGNKHVFKDRPSTKKMTNKLCEVSGLVTDELICSLLPDEECKEFKALANPEQPK